MMIKLVMKSMTKNKKIMLKNAYNYIVLFTYLLRNKKQTKILVSLYDKITAYNCKAPNNMVLFESFNSVNRRNCLFLYVILLYNKILYFPVVTGDVDFCSPLWFSICVCFHLYILVL